MTPEFARLNECLKCGEVLSEHGICPSCGWREQESPSYSSLANDRSGIFLSRESINTIVNNTCSLNTNYGIELIGATLNEIKDNYLSLRSTFDANQEEISNKSDIPGKIDLMRDKLNQIGSNIRKMESDVEKILDQTTETTSEQKIIEDARSGIIGWIVAAIMTFIAFLLGWKSFI